MREKSSGKGLHKSNTAEEDTPSKVHHMREPQEEPETAKNGAL